MANALDNHGHPGAIDVSLDGQTLSALLDCADTLGVTVHELAANVLRGGVAQRGPSEPNPPTPKGNHEHSLHHP